MEELLIFIFGTIFGGIIGIFLMCLLQINRLNNKEN